MNYASDKIEKKKERRRGEVVERKDGYMSFIRIYRLILVSAQADK